MFVWLGINVDDQLKNVGEIAKEIEKKLCFENSNFTLPLHISLKMPFQVPDGKFNSVILDICNVFDGVESFDLEVKGIEYEPNIIWIMMERNSLIDSLHDRINDMLLEKYGVPLHEYDCDYKFHTTLFMDTDHEKIREASCLISGASVPAKLKINKFLVGMSDSGELGSYKVLKEIVRQ